MNVFLVINELLAEHTEENYQFSLMYFGTSMMSDLVIFEVILSPSIAYPIFIYSTGYLIGITTFAILGGMIKSSHNFYWVIFLTIPLLATTFVIFYILQRRELERFI